MLEMSQYIATLTLISSGYVYLYSPRIAALTCSCAAVIVTLLGLGIHVGYIIAAVFATHGAWKASLDHRRRKNRIRRPWDRARRAGRRRWVGGPMSPDGRKRGPEQRPAVAADDPSPPEPPVTCFVQGEAESGSHRRKSGQGSGAAAAIFDTGDTCVDAFAAAHGDDASSFAAAARLSAYHLAAAALRTSLVGTPRCYWRRHLQERLARGTYFAERGKFGPAEALMRSVEQELHDLFQTPCACANCKDS